MEEQVELTADVDGVAEGVGDFGVELDHQIVLFGDVIVAVLDEHGDPFSEGFADDGVHHVDDPLPGKTMHVALVGQVQADELVFASLLDDGLDGKALVHGHVQVLGIGGFDDYMDVSFDDDYLHFFVPRTISFKK